MGVGVFGSMEDVEKMLGTLEEYEEEVQHHNVSSHRLHGNCSIGHFECPFAPPPPLPPPPQSPFLSPWGLQESWISPSRRVDELHEMVTKLIPSTTTGGGDDDGDGGLQDHVGCNRAWGSHGISFSCNQAAMTNTVVENAQLDTHESSSSSAASDMQGMMIDQYFLQTLSNPNYNAVQLQGAAAEPRMESASLGPAAVELDKVWNSRVTDHQHHPFGMAQVGHSLLLNSAICAGSMLHSISSSSTGSGLMYQKSLQNKPGSCEAPHHHQGPAPMQYLQNKCDAQLGNYSSSNLMQYLQQNICEAQGTSSLNMYLQQNKCEAAQEEGSHLMQYGILQNKCEAQAEEGSDLMQNKCEEEAQEGSHLMQYRVLQNKCEEAHEGSSDLMQYVLQNKCEAHEGSDLMQYVLQNKCEAQEGSQYVLQNKCEAGSHVVQYLQNICEGAQAGSHVVQYLQNIYEEAQKQKLNGSLQVLASSLPTSAPLLLKKKKKQNISSFAAAAATAEVQNINTVEVAKFVPQKQNRNKIFSKAVFSEAEEQQRSSTSLDHITDRIVEPVGTNWNPTHVEPITKWNPHHVEPVTKWNSNHVEAVTKWNANHVERVTKGNPNIVPVTKWNRNIMEPHTKWNPSHVERVTKWNPYITEPVTKVKADVEPVTKWNPNVVTVEEKCALPPLTAVMKCALPTRRYHSGRRVTASNARLKRPLWPGDNNNNISGFLHKKPIAKWPVVVEGCTRLEAVSTLAHHTVVTQNTCNARTLGPALNTNLMPRARQGSANDPQSIAARVRRERISDRLKALQLLIPNGDKVDMVTMLEKAINYVRCLELQIRMLKDDSLWPKALRALPNTFQELLELAGPEFAALREEEEKNNKKEKMERMKEDPLSSPTPSSNDTE